MAGACFRAVAESRLLSIHPVVVKGRSSNELPEFRWINTVLQQLEKPASAQLPCLRFEKVTAIRYLGAFQLPLQFAVQSWRQMTEACGSCHLQLVFFFFFFFFFFSTAERLPEVVRSLLPNRVLAMSCYLLPG